MKHTKIVWDGKKLEVPCDMGCPKETQLKGSDYDNLVELAGRVCYDSLGSGRDSLEYHKHIIEVAHGSVQEHANLTFAVPVDVPTYLACAEALVNRPGIWMTKEIPTITIPGQNAAFIMRITANLRSIREWMEFPPANKMAFILGAQIQHLAKQKAPLVLQDLETRDLGVPMQVVEPKYDDEFWVTMFFTNVSRGFSHELVRHKFRTAVSQRSTRYVDEGESHWCWHPLILKNVDLDAPLVATRFWESETGDGNQLASLSLNNLKQFCQEGYKQLVEKLQAKMIEEGIDKFTARKQARGAARGLLGNALNTELIFSASVAQWKWMFQLRAAAAADAEIRVVMNEVYELLNERMPEHFGNYVKVACPDKLGYGLEEKEDNKLDIHTSQR
jgi:thymidylate synthase ThyX